MPSVNFQAPTEYSAEADEIARRRKYAELLQKQSIEPLAAPPTPAGGFAVPISPMAGLAKMLQAYTGAKGQADATAQQKALGQRYRTEGNEALARGLQAYRGTPASSEQIMDETAAGGEGQMAQIQAPARPGDPAAAMAAWGSHPQTAGMSQALLAQMLKQNDPYSLREGEKRFGPNGQVVADNPKAHPLHFANTGDAITPLNAMTGAPAGTPIPVSAKPDKNEGAWGEPYNLGGAYVQKNDLTGQVRQAVAREPVTHISVPPPITNVTIQDPNDPTGMGTLQVDGRTGRVIGKGAKLTQTGVAEQKLQLGLPQAKLRVDSMGQNLDRLDTALGELHDNPGLTNITGTIMGRTPNLTNKATGAQAQLNSIKSQIFQSSLQAMREASKTGGAVGNVSDREGDKLERTLAALDQAQGTPSFKTELKKAAAQVRQSKSLIQSAFEEQYGGVQGRNSDGPPMRRTGDIPDAAPEGAVRRK